MPNDIFVRSLFFVFSFLIFFFFIVSSSTVYSICWIAMRLVSSAVILCDLLYSTSACSWKIEIANSPYLVGKDSNHRSSLLHIRPPVIAGVNRFQFCDLNRYQQVTDIENSSHEVAKVVLKATRECRIYCLGLASCYSWQDE